LYSLQSVVVATSSSATMDDNEDDGYSSSGSFTHGPDETVSYSQPPLGDGHILQRSQLELLLLLHLFHLVVLSGALWIKNKHIWNRNGNNAFNSSSRLLAAVVLVIGKGNNSSQLQAFLGNSKLIRIRLLLLQVIPLVPSHYKVPLFKSLHL
jgi:hypothetical protein